MEIEMGDHGAAPAGRFDIAFVGAGVATSYTLLGLIERLIEDPPSRPVRTVVIEQAETRYGGVPYGGRSAPTSLIITSLRDFLPMPELEPFLAWLSANKAELLAGLASGAGPNTLNWLATNCEAIERDEWLDLYVPRNFFGRYMDERIRDAVAAAEADGLIEHTFVHATVIAVERATGGYAISLGGPVGGSEGALLSAERVVLAIGSMPLQPRFDVRQADGIPCLIDDLYTPGGVANVSSVRAAIAAAGGTANVLVLGANASSLEALYLLNDLDDPVMANARFVVMSPGGEFPERSRPPSADAVVTTTSLDALGTTGAFTAEQLHDAAADDIARAKAAGYAVSESLPVISRAFGSMVAELSAEEKFEFAARWGVKLGRLQRRAGSEYSDNVTGLRAAGRLVSVAGSYLGIVGSSEAGVLVEFETGGARATYPDRFAVVINCAGFSSTKHAEQSPLVSQLVSSGVCEPVITGCGLVVNDAMEAAPGFFVLGPLLSGNVVNGSAIWHMEHCGRISSWGRTLAEILAVEAVTR